MPIAHLRVDNRRVALFTLVRDLYLELKGVRHLSAYVRSRILQRVAGFGTPGLELLSYDSRALHGS